jgi:hypothetical protein
MEGNDHVRFQRKNLSAQSVQIIFEIMMGQPGVDYLDGPRGLEPLLDELLQRLRPGLVLGR